MPKHTANPHSKAAKLPPLSDAKKADGTWDGDKFMAVATQMYNDWKAGHLAIEHSTYDEEPDGTRNFYLRTVPI